MKGDAFMPEDKSFYQVGGGLFLAVLVMWQVQAKVVTLHANFFIRTQPVYVRQTDHPNLFWFLILCEIIVAYFLFYKGTRLHKSGPDSPP